MKGCSRSASDVAARNIRPTGRAGRSLARSVLGIAAIAAVATSPARAVQNPPPPAASRPLSTPDAARRAADRLRALQAEADALLKQERTLLVELRRLEVERDIRTARVRELEETAAQVDEQLAATSAHLAALEKVRTEQAPLLRARLMELYKLGRPGYVRLLVGIDDVRQAGRAMRAVSALAATDRERARAHASTLASLQRARADLVARQSDLVRLRSEAVASRAAAERAVRERAALVASIDSRRDLNARLMGELQAARQRLQQTVGGLSSADAILPISPFRGVLDWPVAGRVRAWFGALAPGGTAPRTGIEIAAGRQTAVTAIHEGVVAFAAPFAGFGNLVIVDHGSRAFSLYGYLDELAVARGARVARGQVIGRTGTSPLGADALYFELRIDGQPVDPLQWLKGR